MPLNIARLLELRPYLYHLTASQNLDLIRRSCRLACTAELLTRAGRADEIATHRPRQRVVTVDGLAVVVRDQKPLNARRIAFEDGWDLARLVRVLNQRVFFWPGSRLGPIPHGMRHYACNEAESPAVLRVSTAALVAANPDTPPEFCRYNSGAPGRNPQFNPRGGRTFLSSELCDFREADVKEVTFVGGALLPTSTELRDGSWHSWVPLFSDGGQGR